MVEAFTKYRKTHNDAVFDAYTADIRKCRSSHILTGLPDAYGRGRIIGDYRASRSTASRGSSSANSRRRRPSMSDDVDGRGHPRLRGAPGADPRAQGAAADGRGLRLRRFDPGPERDAKPVQWLYFGYLAAVKEQNGAAMSLGRTSTFLDAYFERDLAAGVLTEDEAQEIVDDFVIKLRIVRFLRTPEYDELFAGDPTWVTESIGGMGDDGRPLVTKTSFRYLRTLHNLGPAPEPTDRALLAAAARGVPAVRRQGRDRYELHPVRERRDHPPLLGRRRCDRLLRVAHARREADAVLRGPRERSRSACCTPSTAAVTR